MPHAREDLRILREQLRSRPHVAWMQVVRFDADIHIDLIFLLETIRYDVLP